MGAWGLCRRVARGVGQQPRAENPASPSFPVSGLSSVAASCGPQASIRSGATCHLLVVVIDPRACTTGLVAAGKELGPYYSAKNRRLCVI